MDEMRDPVGSIAEIFGGTVLERDDTGQSKVIRLDDRTVMDVASGIFTVTTDDGRVFKYDLSSANWSMVS